MGRRADLNEKTYGPSVGIDDTLRAVIKETLLDEPKSTVVGNENDKFDLHRENNIPLEKANADRQKEEQERFGRTATAIDKLGVAHYGGDPKTGRMDGETVDKNAESKNVTPKTRDAHTDEPTEAKSSKSAKSDK